MDHPQGRWQMADTIQREQIEGRHKMDRAKEMAALEKHVEAFERPKRSLV